MSGEDQLAIIIPAYKANYLQSTMESISKQTDRNFHLYIGDDAGDSNIPEIVDSFRNILEITYQRFEVNLGNKSLVSHWNRCFEMVGSEKWLWLFSDDDLMSHNCVENFRKAVRENRSFKIFKHDSVKFVDDLKFIRENSFDGNVSTIQFLKSKFTYAAESYVVEYVFHRDLLKITGGFPDFPFGWCSDDLFWVWASQHSPIVKIWKTKIFWRYSELNVSGRLNSRSTSKGKLHACYLFLKALKSSNILILDPQLSKLAVSWYFDQFFYLKPGLSYYDQMLCLLEIFVAFPRQLLDSINLRKTSEKRI